MLEMLGISGSGYEFRFVKISAYIDPFDYSKQIRLLIKVFFETKKESFSNPLYIYFQSDREIKIKNGDIFDRSQRVVDERYLKRIGADKKEETKIPLKIKEINSVSGENNVIRVEIIPDDIEMSDKTENMNLDDNCIIKSGFMIDIMVENEGIEKEPLWRRLSGWSRFAWKFHFKVWSITEDIEPIKAIFPRIERKNTEEIYFTNSTDEVQMFLIIPKSLVESYGQVVTHPGGDTVHIITKRDKNTYLILEEIKEEEKKRELEKRIKETIQEGAMAISWSYGQTGSMSREVIVEHRRAHPRFWTFLTFATLLLILGTKILPEIFPFSLSKQVRYFWEICLILFVFSYFYTNLYNFSFYELKKKTGLRYLIIFLRISIISIIAIFIPVSRIASFPTASFPYDVFLTLVTLFSGSILTYLIENEKIKRRDIKIREPERTSYMLIKILIQIVAICFVVYLTIQTFDFINMNSFPFLFACAYAIAVVLEISEGRAINWLQV